MASHDFLPAIILPLILLAVATSLLKRWNRPPFPPGPKPMLITGNLHDIPKVFPWITYTEWAKRYGDVVHIEAFGNHILIVNSVKVAMELFEKRSGIYSDRPTIPMLPLTGGDFSLVMMSHTDKWRQVASFTPAQFSQFMGPLQYKRMFHEHFRREAVAAYRLVQLSKIHDLLHNLLYTPADFVAHAKTFDLSRLAAAVIMATVYGYDINPTHDRFVSLVEKTDQKLAEMVVPGRFAVNTFPFLRYFPSWFPGCSGFQRFARGGKHADTFQRDGVGRSSVLRELLEDNDNTHNGSEAREQMIKDVAAVAYAAAAETTAATLVVFILAMALNPKVVRKAQNEIDAVVGVDTLPGFEHRSSLPYCEAVLREVFRWRPIVPLGVPHATSEDDIYEGYFIPKGRQSLYFYLFQGGNIVLLGTTVFPNVWAMVHDESVYGPYPDHFNPERFLNPDGQLNADDHILGFGFGRRTCAGRYAADATVWATIVSVLSAFNIAKAKDETGEEIEIQPALQDGLISHPEPFKCAITPRNDVAMRLIENPAYV
ncbi:cytochrome P450 [Mycena galopus ATCC 62051]|nr:cytochrome P450 [Mycena galopus ATCC 62051]